MLALTQTELVELNLQLRATVPPFAHYQHEGMGLQLVLRFKVQGTYELPMVLELDNQIWSAPASIGTSNGEYLAYSYQKAHFDDRWADAYT